eukprot:3401551-Rhodomonas_salina.2
MDMVMDMVIVMGIEIVSDVVIGIIFVSNIVVGKHLFRDNVSKQVASLVLEQVYPRAQLPL